MNVEARRPVWTIVRQHAEDAAVLRNSRSHLVAAPHVRLNQLQRLDERLAAHLDGLAVAGAHGSGLAVAGLEHPGRGELFVATVCVIEEREAAALERFFSLAEAIPDSLNGFASAFGWVSAASLRGIAGAMLASPSAFRKRIGLTACAMHQVDPGAAIDEAADSEDPELRACAFRVAGRLGLARFLPRCRVAMSDTDSDSAVEAAHAALLLGDRGGAWSLLGGRAMQEAMPVRTLALTLRLSEMEACHAVLRHLSSDAANARLLIKAIGFAGDPHFVPWLISQMQDPKAARLAGESFSFITGLDLAYLDLERTPPTTLETGPNDNPADIEVAMDEDESLPWPDPEKIGAWWQSNGHRFVPGARYFMGEPPSPAHCLSVLRTGFQRQRKAAAIYLCLMNPGTPLFNTAAPAWRQQRWLDAMGA